MLEALGCENRKTGKQGQTTFFPYLVRTYRIDETYVPGYPDVMRFTATGLRANLYRVLDRVAKTGVPVEIERDGKILKIVPAGARDKLAGLKRRKRYLAADPESLVHIDWSGEWRP